MGLKSFVKKGLKGLVGGVLGASVSLLLKPIGSLLSALLPKPKIPKSLEQSGTTYNAEARVNSSKLGDIKAVVYGQAWVWPAYCAMPYKFFEGHDQVLAAYLHITVGQAQIPIIRIGDTSATRFPGFQSELCLPGEDMTLVLPNVYTCPEVEQIEMYGGLLSPLDITDHVSVKTRTEGTITFDAGASTVTYDDPVLESFNVGDIVGFRLDSSDDNEGIDFTLVTISDDLKTATLSPAPTSVSVGGGSTFLRQRWAGPYPACPPGATVDTIALDFVFAALRNPDEDDNKLSVTIKIQYREIDDLGNYTGAGTWTEETVTHVDDVNRPRRYTDEFVLYSPMRCEVRAWRLQAENSTLLYSSALQWTGLKGYIVAKPGDTPFSDDDSTRLSILVRSSGFLSSQSENAVNCLVQRLIPIYESGGWSDPVFTRNPAWAAVDWMVNQSNGAITLADLDVDSFVTSAAAADANSDTFDAVFDREVALWEGAQSILRVARSKPIRDPFTRLYKVYRDEPSDPVQLFCDGFNCTTGSDSISLPDADTVTGVYVTFMDPLLWTEREGPTIGTEVDPRKSRGFGLTTWDAAWREANFQYRDLLYRNHTVSISTEMEGLLPIHGNRVLLASAEKGWGHAGEVVEQDGTTLRVWPAPVWTTGMAHYVYLQDDDGIPHGPFTCSQGLSSDIIELDSDPGLTLRIGASWRSLFAFGHDGDESTDADAPRVAIVTERQANTARTATLQLLFDHAYVHEDPGPAPEDPYATDGTVPDLTITGLVATAEFTGAILDETGAAILDETGDALLDEGGTLGVVIHVEWDSVAGATSYQLRWRYVGDPTWNTGISSIDNQADFSVASDGTVQIRVKALSTSYIGAETPTSIVITEFP